MRGILLLTCGLLGGVPLFGDTLQDVRDRGVLRWGGDAEGGAPYSFPDPEDPSRLIGFEVDIASELGRRLGVGQQMVQTPWSTLPQSLLRRDFDVIINGLEVTPERREFIAFSIPYYEFHLALTVHQDNQDIRQLADLTGKRVATLKGTLAQQTLERIPGANLLLYEDNVSPYRDINNGRVDAVLMDYPIAHYYGEKVPNLKSAGRRYGSGFYAIGIRKEDVRLRETMDALLQEMKADGSLDAILNRWGLIGEEEVQFEASREPLSTYLPLLAKAAAMTVFLSVVSMVFAVGLGWGVCLMRLYGSRLISKAAIGYIELFRGTPLLLQLLVIYFGLPSLGLAFPAWTAGIIGLSLNYASYEAEIYRGAIKAVPRGQMEAALSLGMPLRTSVRHVILPQAFRISLPASTNDFIALFKDSSLCSVIGVVELTKQFNILAISTWRILELGLLTGLLYLAMSYPLSLAARRLERRLGKGR